MAARPNRRLIRTPPRLSQASAPVRLAVARSLSATHPRRQAWSPRATSSRSAARAGRRTRPRKDCSRALTREALSSDRQEPLLRAQEPKTQTRFRDFAWPPAAPRARPAWLSTRDSRADSGEARYSPKPRLGACTLAANGRVDAEGSGEVRPRCPIHAPPATSSAPAPSGQTSPLTRPRPGGAL